MKMNLPPEIVVFGVVALVCTALTIGLWLHWRNEWVKVTLPVNIKAGTVCIIEYVSTPEETNWFRGECWIRRKDLP